MPLTDYVSRTWFIDYLIRKEVAVEYWDVTRMLRGELKEYGEKPMPYVRKFGSYKEFETVLADAGNRENIYFSLISMDGHSLGLYRLLGKYGCETVFVNWGGMPIKSISNMDMGRIISKLLNPLRIINVAYYLAKKYIYIKCGFIKKYSLSLVAGEQLLRTDNFAAKVVPINMSDYDTYRNKVNQKTRFSEGQYVVFLDINLPFQSDLALAGDSVLNADEYYASLNRFFMLIERAYATKVVIASHHKANNASQRFGGRECYHGKTAELVRDADFVISHHSTSIGYAVLNRKPIVFIYTDEMQKLYSTCRVRWIQDLAQYFELPAYNVDQITDGSQIIIQPPSRERYDSYKYNYLTSHESENSSSAEIFWCEINAI